MRGEPWTDMELQELYEVVNDIDWFDHVAPMLPTRTNGAIRRRMCQLREEAGIIPTRAVPRRATEAQKAKAGSDKLLRAMLEAA